MSLQGIAEAVGEGIQLLVGKTQAGDNLHAEAHADRVEGFLASRFPARRHRAVRVPAIRRRARRYRVAARVSSEGPDSADLLLERQNTDRRVNHRKRRKVRNDEVTCAAGAEVLTHHRLLDRTVDAGPTVQPLRYFSSKCAAPKNLGEGDVVKGEALSGCLTMLSALREACRAAIPGCSCRS